jgi:hypothetical protein
MSIKQASQCRHAAGIRIALCTSLSCPGKAPNMQLDENHFVPFRSRTVSKPASSVVDGHSNQRLPWLELYQSQTKWRERIAGGQSD